MEEIEIEVYGRVQGIMFRRMLKNFADRSGITGFAENREDGSVKIIAQGKRKDLKKLVEWIEKEPGLSKISRMKYDLGKCENKLELFEIKRTGNYVLDKVKSVVNLGKNILNADNRDTPVHVAIIPDGNRRWAKEKGLSASTGHIKAGGYENIRALIKEAERLKIKYITVWGFSTENWKRDKKEVETIFSLIEDDIRQFISDSEKDKIKFRHIGRKDRLPMKLRRMLEELEDKTRNNSGITAVLCLDYGGRDELVRAVNRMLKQGVKNVDEGGFENYLDSSGIPDPDLIIRTSGEQRTSGFMPYQGVYAELYFSSKYFPDFTAEDLDDAVKWYANRDRRFGGNSR